MKVHKCIDCHKCENYDIESEGKWSFGVCGINKNRKLNPKVCKDYKLNENINTYTV